MTSFFDLKHLFGVMACAAALSACGTTPVVPKGPAPLADLLNQATQAAGSGQKEQAVSMWKQAAAAYPADKTPWASIAQTRYDAGQYGEAIVSAQEVLLRDPNDKAANSIIAIAGLRLSTRALGDLNRQNGMTPALRTESQDLAKLLRENLGESPVASSVRRTEPVKRRDKAEKTSKTDKDDGNKSDPFDLLK
ncbi:hypothetical protein PO883_12950 [Massilia sp. DJPM01]|uniref:tetratricopeptide repeat protein n=1 Tax=Massilia sp. DJPM01 TaxID=3024404 RepID=UPI00259F4B46|nr:hypothetical protein [Massilia sp. DJPM01]MDM5178099.1 hypothetical protein [Massilia sp. DJPM01]